jgi:hypothetical protein
VISLILDTELFLERPIFQSLNFLSDLTFTHEGNKTYFDGLVNFEKMVCTYIFIKIKDITLFLITGGFYIIWLLYGKRNKACCKAKGRYSYIYDRSYFLHE